jgi:hypothetical protein
LFRFFTPFPHRPSRRLRNCACQLFWRIVYLSPYVFHLSYLSMLKHTRRPISSVSLAWRRLYGKKTVREAERAWFLSEGEESEALIRVAFDSQGQKQRVLEPYRLSLSSMVASSIPKHLFYPGKKMLTFFIKLFSFTKTLDKIKCFA